MDASIMAVYQVPLDLQLLCQIVLKLFVDVFYDGLAAVFLVDLVPITSCTDYSQSELHVALLQVCMLLKTPQFLLITIQCIMMTCHMYVGLVSLPEACAPLEHL